MPGDQPQSRPRPIRAVLLLAGLLLAALPLRAQEQPKIDFDLINRHDSLAVLLDLSFLLNSAHISRLRDGIDLGIECRLSVRRPRRLFGSVRLVERDFFCRLSYQALSKSYQLTTAQPATPDTVTVSSLSRLHAYLTDSVTFALLNLDSLASDERHVVDIEVSAISLNSINLASGDDDSESDRSPLKLLFEQFLILTDYGRETFSTSSRPFSPAEISPR